MTLKSPLEAHRKKSRQLSIRILYILAGIVSLAIGLAGIFIPGLPTTPFLLLTASLWIRSSGRLYNWLINNRYFGHYIVEYRRNKGLNRRTKIGSVAFMWVMVGISCVFFISSRVYAFVIILAGLAGTAFIVWLIPAAKDPEG